MAFDTDGVEFAEQKDFPRQGHGRPALESQTQSDD
jgi:hypothetical protein